MTLSPDGKHQWDGTQWVAIPAPPKSGVDKAHSAFQVGLVVLVVLFLLALLGEWILTT